MKILALYPTREETQVAVFDREGALARFSEPVPADVGRLPFAAQIDSRIAGVRAVLDPRDAEGLDAVVSRGGMLRPMPGGTYLVNDRMLLDLETAAYGEHPSNLGAPMAHGMATYLSVPAFIVDPVSVDEMSLIARFSGMNGIDRVSLSTALGTKASAKRYARDLNRSYETLRLIVAHLGEGVSVSAHCDGRMVDVNHSGDEGPFGLTRSGGVPALPLVDLAFSGSMGRAEIRQRLFWEGGLRSYLGTDNLGEILDRVESGDSHAADAFRAMIYQIAKEIGSMATVLEGRIDGIVLTGPMMSDPRVADALRPRISFLAPIEVMAVDDPLRDLADGALRILDRLEPLKTYD